MIDHLVCFEDEAAAMAALPEFVSTIDGEPRWNDSRTMATRAYIPGVYGDPDPETGEIEVITPEITLPGYRRIIMLTEARLDMPGLELVADRAQQESGERGVLFTTLTEEQLAAACLSPTPAGTAYPFGTPPAG